MEREPNYRLPTHQPRRYEAVGKCIYCASLDSLTKEHIIPLSAGGRWILPDASCKKCAALTGAFEGEFSRTIMGPLRMLYNLPTRRPKDRPSHLPLKVKYATSIDWEIANVDRTICPFLVGLPLYPMPDALTGNYTADNRDADVRKMWIRGAGFWKDRDAQLQELCDLLGATEVMPAGEMRTQPFCLTLAKIAHAYATAELGLGNFTPFLLDMITNRNLCDRASFIGGGKSDEPPTEILHEVEFDNSVGNFRNIVVVRIRLFAVLGTPTYFVAVGNRK
jgi:HNH endonuclease